MPDKWTVTVSFPGQTDETSFETESEAVAFASSANQSGDESTVMVVDPEGHSRVIRSGHLSASA